MGSSDYPHGAPKRPGHHPVAVLDRAPEKLRVRVGSVRFRAAYNVSDVVLAST